MGEVINLRLARKARDRKQAEAKAAENRSKFGRSKGEKAAEKAEAERHNRTVDGARLDQPDDPE